MRRAICEKCGEINSIKAIVCKKCGAKIEKRETEMEARIREGTLMDHIMRGPRRFLRRSYNLTRTLVVGSIGFVLLLIATAAVLLVIPLGWSEMPALSESDVAAGAEVFRGPITAALNSGEPSERLSLDQVRQAGRYLLLTLQEGEAPFEERSVMKPLTLPDAGWIYRLMAQTLDGASFNFMVERNGDYFIYTLGGKYRKPALPWRLRVTFWANREAEGAMELDGVMFNNLPLPKSRLPEILRSFGSLIGQPRLISKYLFRVQSGKMSLFAGQNDKSQYTFLKESY